MDSQAFVDALSARLLKRGWLPAPERALERDGVLVIVRAFDELPSLAEARQELDRLRDAFAQVQDKNVLYVTARPSPESPATQNALLDLQKGSSRLALIFVDLSSNRLRTGHNKASDLEATCRKLLADWPLPANYDPAAYPLLAERTLAQVKDWEPRVWGRCWATYSLLALCLLLYFWTASLVRGNLTLAAGHNAQLLFETGGNYPPAVRSGEWWRLVTAIFLHTGLTHIFCNMVVLWSIGRRLEGCLGSWRFLLLAGITGIVGSLFSYTLGPDRVSVGFSGSLCGFLGAWVWLSRAASPLPPRVRYDMLLPERFARPLTLGLLLLSLLSGWLQPGVDNWAHLGGFLAGIVAAFWLESPSNLAASPLIVMLALLPLGVEACACYRIKKSPTPIWAPPTWSWRDPRDRFQVEVPHLFARAERGSKEMDREGRLVGPGLLIQAISRPLKIECFTGPLSIRNLRKAMIAEWREFGKATIEDEQITQVGGRDWLLFHFQGAQQGLRGWVALACQGDAILEVSVSSQSDLGDLKGDLRSLLSSVEVFENPMDQGIAALGRGDFDHAVVDFTRAIEADPAKSAAFASRAWANLRLQHFKEASADLDSWIALHPTAQAYRLRAEVDEKLDLPQQVRKDLQSGLQYASAQESFELLLSLANLLAQQGDLPGALEQLEKARSQGGGALPLLLVYNMRAWLEASAGRFSEALADAQIALQQKVAPENAAQLGAVYDTRGFALAGLKRYPEAIVDYQQALSLTQERGARLWLHLGLAQEAAGKMDTARESYRRCLQEPDAKSDGSYEEAEARLHTGQRQPTP